MRACARAGCRWRLTCAGTAVWGGGDVVWSPHLAADAPLRRGVIELGEDIDLAVEKEEEIGRGGARAEDDL